MSYETREVLNQPFEFEEVLIDSDARRTLLRAGKTNGVFASSEAPRAPSSLLVRKIAVRLRTINAGRGPGWGPWIGGGRV